MITNITPIFLLGGADLEMKTIKALLKRVGVEYKDKCSGWYDATLDKYNDDLKQYSDVTLYNIYGVELRGETQNRNYTLIDHHNEYEGRKSSIEQVAEILNVELSDYEKAVAANDRGYIPEMRKMGLSERQIVEIRAADRKAQGVTADDEINAKTSILNAEKGGDIYVIKAQNCRFSAIVDQVNLSGGIYKNLLLYNESEFTLYGEARNEIKDEICKYLVSKGVDKSVVYCGGGDSGFVGVGRGAISSELLAEVVDIIKQRDEKDEEKKGRESYHIFMFPFQWKIPTTKGEIFSEQIDLNNIKFSNDANWDSIENSSNDDLNTLYNEKGYYYEFVHQTLYESPDKMSLLRHFERVEPKRGGVTYCIKVKEDWQGNYREPLVLGVDAINLNIYSTGVGVLSFYLKNDKHTTPDEVLKINQYGRRLYPPFIDDISSRSEIAEYLKIEGLNSGDCYEDFNSYTHADHNTPSQFVTDFIHQVATNIEVKPVIDDRMFVVSWYKNIPLASSLKSNEVLDSIQELSGSIIKSPALDKFIMSDWWYKYVYVDGQYMMCQNRAMQRDLVDSVTYKRWQNWGTLYGVSRYSIVMLSNSFEDYETHLYRTVETIYARMAELCLVQRASVLRFSSEVSILSNLKVSNVGLSRKISSLYQEYIRFVNQVHFREVTAQEQGIELYDMLYKEMRLEQHIEKLDNEIEELHNHISLRSDRRINSEMALLTVLATVSIPASVVTGYYGMNNNITQDGSDLVWCVWWQTIQIVLLTAVALIALWFRRQNTKRKL